MSPQDPLDGIFSQAAEMDAKAQQLRSSMGYAMGQNPDQQAQARQAAGQLGTTQAYANDNFKPLVTAAKVNSFDYNAFINNAPRAASWLSDANNAAVAHDDVWTLAHLEKVSQDVGSQIAQFPGKMMGGVFRSIGGFGMLMGAVDAEARKPGGALWAKALNLGFNPAGHEGQGEQAAFTGKAIRDYYTPLFTDPSLQPETTSGHAAGFVGDIAGTMTKAALTGPAAPFVFGAEAFGEGGASALEQGATPGQAMFKATGSGALNTALAFIPGGKWGGEQALADAVAQGGKMAVAKELAKGVTARVPRGTALGTGVTVAENLLSRPYAPNTPLLQGAEGNIASFIGLEGAGYLNHAIALTAQSKLKARSPEAFQDAASGIFNGTPAETTHINPERLQTFFQEEGLDAPATAKMIEDLGVKNYVEALASGTDVQIPTANLLAHLDSKQLETLKPDLKLSPEAMSPRQIQEHEANAPERVAQMVEQAKAELPDEQFQAFTQIKSELQDRLEATGRFTPAIAEDNATLLARGLVTSSVREGLDPLEQFQKYGLDITGPDQVAPSMRPDGLGATEDFYAEHPELDPLYFQSGKLSNRLDELRQRLTLAKRGTDVLAQGTDGSARVQTEGSGGQPAEEGTPSGDVRLRQESGLPGNAAGSESAGRALVRRRSSRILEALTNPSSKDSKGIYKALEAVKPTSEETVQATGKDLAGVEHTFSIDNTGPDIYLGGDKGPKDNRVQALLTVMPDGDIVVRALANGDNPGLSPDMSRAALEFAKAHYPQVTDESKVIGGVSDPGLKARLRLPNTDVHVDEFGRRVAINTVGDYAADPLEQHLRAKGIDLTKMTNEEAVQKMGPEGQTLFQGERPSLTDLTQKFEAQGLDLHVNEGRDGITLPKIVVPTDQRGQGVGSAFMKELTQYADATGQRILLSPSTDFGASSVGRLKDFYKEFGFIENKGGGKDFSVSESMYREPEQQTFYHSAKRNIPDFKHLRARQQLSRSLSPSGQSAELTRRAAEAQMSEAEFQKFNEDLASINPDDKRGSITFGPDNKVQISVLEKADASTFIHELGHFWLKMQTDLAQRPDASPEAKADLDTIMKWMGVESPSEITTEHHEQFARAHEAYLREGEAPTQALQGTFVRFKTWLTAIYRKLTDLNVKLTPEVKGVFDRIYASDREIESAKEQMGGEKPLFESAEKAGMTPAAFDAYRATKEREINNAKGALVAQLNRESQRDQLQWWKDELAKAREEVAVHIDADPAQIAFKALSEGKTEDGSPIKLNKDALVAQFGEDILKGLPRHGAKWVYGKEGGMDAQSAAELLGYGSGDKLIQALKDMAPRNERIKADADLMMKQRHGDMLTDGSIAETALEMLHNEDRQKALMTELTALRKLQAQTKEGKAQARATVQEVPPLQTFKDAAQQLVDQTTVRDLEPYKYLVASRQASRDAFKAMGADDYAAAGDAKQKELLNHFLYLEAVKAKTEAAGIASYGKDGQTGKFQAMLGKAGSDYRDQWNALAGRYEFATTTNKELDARKSLAEWAHQQEINGEEIAIDPSLYKEGQPKNWREVPLSELRAVKDALKNIETIARRANKVTANGKAIDFDVAVHDLQTAATENLKSNPVPLGGSTLTAGEKFAKKARSANAALLPMEQLLDRLDGGDVTGPWHEHLMNRASEAQNKEHELAARLAIPIKEALEAIPKDIKDAMLDFSDVKLPGMDRPLNRKQLLSIALNRGNEQNWEKLLKGRGWTSMDSQAELGRGLAKITAPEWEFVQKVWDSFESLRPEIGDLQRKMTGLEPQWVEAKPFAAVDEKGNTVAHLRGGYYPLVADPGESGVGMRQDIDASKGVMDGGSGYVRATTSTGYTKERTKATYPLLLDFEQIVTQHASKIAKDLAYREFVVDANRLLTDQRVRDTLRETLGPEYEKQFMPWLRYQANNRNGSAVQGLGEVSRWMMQLRANAVVATMGFNLATTVVQFSGITRAQHYVEGGHLMRAFGEFLAHPIEATKMVREMSGEMANRGENYDRDMGSVFRGELTDSLAASAHKSVRSLVLPVMKANSEVMKFAFHGILLADVALGIPTWLGAYRQGLAQHGDAARAVLEGDRAVRMTLPAAGAKDLAPIMRNNEFWKMATMYYGHFNKLYANIEDSAHKSGVMAGNGDFLGATKQAGSTALLSLLIPAAAGALFKNRGPGKDDNPAEWAILESLHFGASSIPILRNIADTLKNGKSGKDFKFSPMFGIFEEQTQALMSLEKAAHGEGDWSKAGFDAAKAFGHTFGIGGTTQAVKSAHYLQQVASGQEQPDNVIDLVKNTLLGKNPAAK